jgi:hypothetical protein
MQFGFTLFHRKAITNIVNTLWFTCWRLSFATLQVAPADYKCILALSTTLGQIVLKVLAAVLEIIHL